MTKIGYEIRIERRFYVYKAPRRLNEMKAGLAMLKRKIAGLFKGLWHDF